MMTLCAVRRGVGLKGIAAAAGLLVVAAGWPMVALAATPTPAAASSSVTQGYKVTGQAASFVTGSLVAGTSAAHTVELATSDNAEKLIGVVSQASLVALSTGTGQIQVVTSGTTPTLVSDINGRVRAGDKIAPSPIKGVGMRATANTQVVGTALGELTDSASVAQEVTDRSGQRRTVHIGRVDLRAGVASFQSAGSGLVPPIVQAAVDRLAGRQVAFARIVIAGLLLLAGFTAAAILLSSAVRSGLVSIGRNPLASGAIRKGMLQVGGVIVLVVIFTLAASYIILVV